MARDDRPQQAPQASPVKAVPPPPPAPPTSIQPPWMDGAEAYLADNGWEKSGTNAFGQQLWADPAGAGPKKAVLKPVLTLPGKDGVVETISQGHVPPAAWSYPAEEAVRIQRQRDSANGQHQSVQDRLNDLGRKLDRNTEAFDRLVGAVEAFVKAPTPEKPENFNVLKNRLNTQLQQVRELVNKAG